EDGVNPYPGEVPARTPAAAWLAAMAGSLTEGRGTGALEALEALAEVRRHIDERERVVVAACRTYGVSWQKIADVLGLTRQGAHARHADGSLLVSADEIVAKRQDLGPQPHPRSAGD